MNISINQTGIFCYESHTIQNRSMNSNYLTQYANYENGTGDRNDAASVRRMLYEKRKEKREASAYSKIVEESFGYSSSLRADRANKKKSALQVKKLRYSFKAISTQIMRCKTSVSARQVAGKAKREVVRLRQKLYSSQYDMEEVRIAVKHAQKIERVAKKKVKHLLEEELVKVTGGPCAGELEEREEEQDRILEENERNSSAGFSETEGGSQEDIAASMQEQLQSYRDLMQAQMEQMQQEMEQMTAEMQDEMAASMEDMMSELMDKMAESMKELLEESGLADLMDSMFGGVTQEMDPADYKMMKIKHRTKELKEIAEADAEYLRAVFNRLERMKDSAAQGMSGSSNSTAVAAGVSSGGSAVVVSSPRAAEIVQESGAADMGGASDPVGAAAPVMSGGFDVSV